jgi:hypothetical protein
MADKTLGDYGVEVEKAVESGSCAGVGAIVAEMRSKLPPESEADPAAPKPAPINQGARVYADKLEQYAQINNVFETRQLAEEMKTVEPPTPPPAEPAASTGTTGTGTEGSTGTQPQA